MVRALECAVEALESLAEALEHAGTIVPASTRAVQSRCVLSLKLDAYSIHPPHPQPTPYAVF